VRALARELAQTDTPCSKPLSSHEHDGYGMRAVKSALNAAANLESAAPSAAAATRLCVMSLVGPSSSCTSIALFDGITRELLPRAMPLDTAYAALAVSMAPSARGGAPRAVSSSD
jgi:hypothetical protein